jgi:hypothetical protein
MNLNTVIAEYLLKNDQNPGWVSRLTGTVSAAASSCGKTLFSFCSPATNAFHRVVDSVSEIENVFPGNVPGYILEKICENKTTIIVAVTLGTTAVSWPYLAPYANQAYASTLTRVINLTSREVMPDYRQKFKDQTSLLTMQHSAPRNHSHPEAATLRCKANTFIDHFATMIGKRPYSISMSKTQRRNGMNGQRYYYHAKDLQMDQYHGKINEDTIITMTDVDYYVDLNHFLDDKLMVFYTFVPNEPAGNTTEGVYCTHSDDTVELVMAGGARYRHPLWDFDCDHLVVHHLFYSVYYLVEQINLSDDRRLILINPVRKTYGPFGRLLSGKRLSRRKLNHSGVAFTRFLKLSDGKPTCYYSIARLGNFHSCTVSSNTFTSALIRTDECKEPNLGQIERVFNHAKVPNAVDAAALFFDAYKHHPEVFGQSPVVITQCVDQHTYQAAGPNIYDDGKSSMRAIWPGYDSNTFSPAKSYNNDLACLDGRIKEPRNLEPKLPPIYFTFFTEFVDHLVPNNVRSCLAPLSYDEMLLRFNRPSQRQQIEATKTTMLMENPRVKAFQKAEAYAKIVHPRNISTLPMDHNFTLGQFMYPFMEAILKKTEWYAFGRTPQKISELLHKRALGTTYVIPSDADKLDGSIRGMLRDLFAACLITAYPPEYHEHIRRLENKERYIRATTANKVKYDTGNTILSGSVITSVLGTICNAFIHYCALRHHHDKKEAYRALGIYGGDDGVTFDLPPNTLMRTAAKFGMSFRGEAIYAGDVVPFLGRNYVDPWTTTESFCDVLRQMRKLHLTATPKTVPNELVLYRKAIGIMNTDWNTPFISDWAKNILRVLPNETHEARKYHMTVVDRSYWSKYAPEDQFIPCQDIDMAKDFICDSLGITIARMEEITAIFDKATKLEDFFLCKLFSTDMKVLIDAIVGDELVRAQPRVTIPEKVANNAKLKIKVCRYTEKQQTCPHGDKCLFSHFLPPKQICRHVINKTFCPRGKSCKFDHGITTKERVTAKRGGPGKLITRKLNK